MKSGKLSLIVCVLLMVFIMAKLQSCGVVSSKKDSAAESRSMSSEVVSSETQDAVEVENREPLPDYSDAPHVYVRDLMSNYSQYEGQRVQVYIAGLSDIRVFEDHVFVNPDLEDEIALSAYVPKYNMADYYNGSSSSGKKFIIGGVVEYHSDENRVYLTDGVIMGRLTDDNTEYQNMKSAYAETVKQRAIQKENEFKASAVSVSYDDLLRYPSQWEGVPIYITVQVVKIQTGIIDTIMGAPIQCVIPGTNQEIVLYDHREVKEPTIIEGDTITIYGRGDGLTVMKIKDTSGIIDKTVQTYEVPAVYIEYNY